MNSIRNGNVWSIILAGGKGERLRPAVQTWFGSDKPKQYCTFVGSRSMFQHTLDRTDQISTPERKVTVVSRAHSQVALSQIERRKSGKIIVQPANRDTAAGIFLPLAYILSRQPDARVVVFPSDHFVHPESRFIEAVRCATKAAEDLKGRLLLLGVRPEEPNADYGWIEPGPCLRCVGDYRIFGTESFLEKPNKEECRRAMAAGALWNTLVLVACAADLWEIGRHYFCEMIALLEKYAEAIAARRELQVLEEIYRRMPCWNFSADLLQHIPERIAVLELTETLWSDWGTPDRILATLRRLGKIPAFDLSLSSAG